MKVSAGNLIVPFFIPFHGLTSNDTQLANNAISAPSASLSISPALPTHHDHRHHHDHGRDRPLRPHLKNPLRVQPSTGLEKSSQCPQPPVTSCSAQAATTDSCCVVTPGGVLVHTQFWDLNVGVADSWGIHGLWPDECNGRYYENCDSSRDYSGDQISNALQSSNPSLLDYMNTYWVSDDESSPDFWSHEWQTHGTCVSTLEPSCFTNYQTGQEVVPYFETVVALFKQLNTYQALSNAGITPSDTATYSLVTLQQAVESATSFIPDFVCSDNALTTVMYYLNAEGPLQDGQFVQSHASRSSTCPSSGISYPVKQLNN